MSGTFSDYQAHRWLDALDPCYIALHFDSPFSAGAYASEFQGDGYARVLADLSPASGRTRWSENTLRWHGLAAGVITWIGGWDAATQGNLTWAAQLATPVRVLAGGGWAIPSGDLAISFG